MIIYYFDIIRVSVFPCEADTPAVIDADTELPRPISAQGFKPVPGGYSQRFQLGCRM